jgi:hypothetical protein
VESVPTFITPAFCKAAGTMAARLGSAVTVGSGPPSPVDVGATVGEAVIGVFAGAGVDSELELLPLCLPGRWQADSGRAKAASIATVR